MFYVWEGWKYNARLINHVYVVKNEDSRDYWISSFSLLKKWYNSTMIVDMIIPRINYRVIDSKSIENIKVVTDIHCSWFLKLHPNSKQYPFLHPLKGLLWLRNENVLSYNFMMWMKCCNISNVANLKFYLFWVRCFLNYPLLYTL